MKVNSNQLCYTSTLLYDQSNNDASLEFLYLFKYINIDYGNKEK